MTDAVPSSCPSTMALESFLREPDADHDVGQHLEGCPRCRAAVRELEANNDLLARLARLAPDPAASAGGTGGPDDSIEGYELHEEIHRGGQGIVYRATQLATGRTLAVKILLAGTLATSMQRRRFEREIELVAGLEHPNVVTVYDSGRTRDGCHYFTMRHAAGETLESWLARGEGPGRDLRARLRLFSRICDGVSHAHQHGVIHRDLKPANIIVNAEGNPQVLDFGLAKAIGDDPRGTVTSAGAFLGTIAYASPEQTRGDQSLVDVRSDVYALGVILYELLTGRLPYPGDGPPAAALRAITETVPPPPSAVPGRDATIGRINDELDTIVLKALAKEKERRYQSAAALRDDLGRLLTGAPIEAKRDSAWYVLRKTVGRHRLPAAVAAGFVILLVVFSAVLLVQNRAIRVEVDKVRQINLFLEDTLGSAQPAAGGRELAVRELLDESVHWIDIALADHPEVAAAIRTTVGNSYRGLGLLDEAEAQLVAAWQARLGMFGAEHVQVAQSLNALGLLRRDQGRPEEAERLFLAALDLRRELLGERSYEVALSLANLAILRRGQGDLAGAEALFRESLEVRRALFGNVHQDVAMGLYRLAETAELAGDDAEALRLHQEALDMRRAVLHRKHPDLARSLHGLGALRLRTGRADAAVPLLQEGLDLRRGVLPAGHWLIGATLADLGAAVAAAGRPAEAEAILLEAEAILGGMGSERD